MGKIEARLAELGIVLPDAPIIKANPALVPGVAVGNLFFCQDALWHHNGEFPYLGKVGDKVSVDEAYQSARLCAINHLAQAKAVLGDLHAHAGQHARLCDRARAVSQPAL